MAKDQRAVQDDHVQGVVVRNGNGRDMERIAQILLERRPVTVLTGAGVSTASGIPDFRSPTGLWARYPIEEYGTIQAFRDNPEKVWIMIWDLARLLDHAQPNAAHHAIAKLETMGAVDAVITQNIDGLHQKAGSKRVIELHGSIDRILCLQGCGTWTTEEILQGRLDGPAPRCPRCGSVLKPDVTFFGEEVPQGRLYAAFHQARYCGAMLVAGTSATVAPASLLPSMAANLGAVIIEANKERTDLTSRVHEHISGPNEETLPRLARALEKLADRKSGDNPSAGGAPAETSTQGRDGPQDTDNDNRKAEGEWKDQGQGRTP